MRGARKIAAAAMGAAFLSWAIGASPQPKPAPKRPAQAAAAVPPIVIRGATVFLPGGRPPLADGSVLVSDGRIKAVGAALTAPEGARTIDARGKVVTPGFIDASTQVGVAEVLLEAPTVDTDSTGDPIQPAFRVIDGYNPRSVVIPITRLGGVTSVVVAPVRGLLGGSSAFVDLVGDTVAEAVVKPYAAQHAWIDESTAQTVAGTRGGTLMKLREALDDARVYATRKLAYEENRSRALSIGRLHLEALQPVLRGEQPLVVTARRASDIETALRLADELKLRLILSGGSEAWMLKDELARRKIPVIVDPMENLPTRFESLHARSDQAAILSQAGALVILSTFTSHQVRTLWQAAGNAVRYGMDHDAAIRAITETPAAAFGVTDHGKIEPGAVANLVVWSGDPLDTSSRVEHVILRGRELPLDSRQRRLLERYRTLPVVRAGVN
jgi:imidazolonepropionase-like amidohydrolase